MSIAVAGAGNCGLNLTGVFDQPGALTRSSGISPARLEPLARRAEVVATPAGCRCLMALRTLRAGKDTYAKPLTARCENLHSDVPENCQRSFSVNGEPVQHQLQRKAVHASA